MRIQDIAEEQLQHSARAWPTAWKQFKADSVVFPIVGPTEAWRWFLRGWLTNGYNGKPVQKCYRIKHKPSGLYYIPSRNVNISWTEGGTRRSHRVKSNLSKAGKVYLKAPTLQRLGSAYYNHQAALSLFLQELTAGSSYRWPRTTVSVIVESEWVVEEVTES